jgi:hypothetical protein
MRLPSWGDAITDIVETTISHLLSCTVRSLKKKKARLRLCFAAFLFLLSWRAQAKLAKTKVTYHLFRGLGSSRLLTLFSSSLYLSLSLFPIHLLLLAVAFNFRYRLPLLQKRKNITLLTSRHIITPLPILMYKHS